MGKLIFVGGIHGVGKGTICNKICDQTNFSHLSSSDVLRWNEISEKNNKRVVSIANSQKRLIEGLEELRQTHKSYLLDGHFCLFNEHGDIKTVSQNTFDLINPEAIVVVTDSINIILSRLNQRDGRNYNTLVLEEMQEMELIQGRSIALTLGIPFLEIKNGKYQSLLDLLNQ